MPKKLVHQIKRRVSRLKGKKPLQSRNRDVAVLRRLRNRQFPSWEQLQHIRQILSPNEYQLFRAGVIIFAFSFLWSGVTLFQMQREVLPAVGGKHIEALVGTPGRINPLFASVNDVDRDVARLVYSGLMKLDKSQQLVPDLAESFEQSEDKKTYTFKLKEEVTWHDGEPFTSNDVIFTMDMIQDPLVNSPLRVSFEGVSVEALDNHTVQFTLPEPFQPFLSTLTVGMLPEHIWFDISAERVGLAQQNLQPVGTGPFLFKKLVKDDSGLIHSIELQRFQNFYNRPPYIKDFVFRFFGGYDGIDGAIRALRDEKVTAIGYVPFDLRDSVDRKYISLRTLRLPQYTALFLNQKHTDVLQDDNVRLALTKALDKDRIVRQSLGGEAQVIHGPLLPGTPGYTDQVEPVDFAMGEANGLLDKKWKRISAEEYRAMRKEEVIAQLKEEAAETLGEGVDDATAEEGSENTDESDETPAEDTSGEEEVRDELDIRAEEILDEELNNAQTFYRKNGDDEILTLTIVTSDTPEYKQASQIIAGYWEEIGIKTIIQFVPARDISREVLKSRDYDVLLYGLIVGENPDQYPFWHSSQTDFPGLNLSRYVNRKLDGILEKIRETNDTEELSKLYQQFQTIILEERPAIFLYTPIYTYATLTDIKGHEVDNIFGPSDRFADVTDWYIKTKRR